MPDLQSILIIEDDLVDQMAFSRVLSKHFSSAKIVTAENIKEGITKMEQHRFDWVISDFNLPDGTVMDILQFAKTNKMICVSGETAESKIQFLSDRGFVKFLLKDQHLNYLQNLVEIIKGNDDEKTPASIAVSNEISLSFLLNKFDADFTVVKDILTIFQQHGPKDLEQLQNALFSKNKNDCHNIAHRIKSGYRVLGLKTALQLLETMENHFQKDQVDWKKMETSFKQVKSIFDTNNNRIPTLLVNYSSNA